jgi:hypothetical protein
MCSVPLTVIAPDEGGGGELPPDGDDGGVLGVVGVVLDVDDDDVLADVEDDVDELLDGAAGELPPPHAAAHSTTATPGTRVPIRKRRVKTRKAEVVQV